MKTSTEVYFISAVGWAVGWVAGLIDSPLGAPLRALLGVPLCARLPLPLCARLPLWARVCGLVWIWTSGALLLLAVSAFSMGTAVPLYPVFIITIAIHFGSLIPLILPALFFEITSKQGDQERSHKTIILPPGTTSLRIAEIVVSSKKYHVCEDLVAGWHEEYFKAIDDGHGRIKFLFIRIRWTWAFLKAVGLLSVFQAAEGIVKAVRRG